MTSTIALSEEFSEKASFVSIALGLTFSFSASGLGFLGTGGDLAPLVPQPQRLVNMSDRPISLVLCWTNLEQLWKLKNS